MSISEVVFLRSKMTEETVTKRNCQSQSLRKPTVWIYELGKYGWDQLPLCQFFFNMSKMVFFAITPIFMFFWHLNVFYTIYHCDTGIRITYPINVRRKILFIFNQFKTVPSCVFDFSASEYLRVSWLFYVQRNILQTAVDGQWIHHRTLWLAYWKRAAAVRLG